MNNKNFINNLTTHSVHVWRAELSKYFSQLDYFYSLLSADEVERAQRFIFDIHRQRFVAGRGILRLLLSQYLNYPANKLVFTYDEHEKPWLDMNIVPSDPALFFNVSNSEDLVVIALAHNELLGIDVEFIRHDIEITEIAERFFSSNECNALNKVPDENKYKAFFTIWSRKEAFIKAIGEGLTFPLKDFDVSLIEQPNGLLSIKGNQEAAQQWSLLSLDFGAEYCGALAYKGKIKELLQQDFIL